MNIALWLAVICAGCGFGALMGGRRDWAIKFGLGAVLFGVLEYVF